ncbi:hypothetical protein D3C80_1623230 [compost metagenome]
MAQLLAHPADLQVEPLREYNPELPLCYRISNTRLRDGSENGDTGGHGLQECCGYRLVHGYMVFLLMLIF